MKRKDRARSSDGELSMTCSECEAVLPRVVTRDLGGGVTVWGGVCACGVPTLSVRAPETLSAAAPWLFFAAMAGYWIAADLRAMRH